VSTPITIMMQWFII